MASFVPSTQAQRQEMLDAIGVKDSRELFARMIPVDVPSYPELSLPKGKGELEVRREMSAMAGKNHVFQTVFRGAGAYRHYIPAIVGAVTSKEEFVTAYTPYQPEISQGILQSIFEFQSMICELTGMDVANASVYDGASAAAEAAAMCRERKRTKTLISGAMSPEVIETVRTYCWATDTPFEVIPVKDGATDLEQLSSMLDETVSGVILAQPNFFGILEDTQKAGEIIHAAGAKYILSINPIAATLLKTPAQCGADIAIGEGQPLGLPLAFGGPYLGFMASTSGMMRRLPGRIVGQTVDSEGNRAFVLTLQAREQHIRREKASSNICSNQAWCALTASVYMASMGTKGIQEAARQSMSKAHYLAEQLERVCGFTRAHSREFFHEFVSICPVEPSLVLEKLEQNGILGGLPVAEGILWCTTELNTKEEIDSMVSLIAEVMA